MIMFFELSALVFLHSILYAQAHLHIPLILCVFGPTRTIVGSNDGTQEIMAGARLAQKIKEL